jgi:hypothetical protein
MLGLAIAAALAGSSAAIAEETIQVPESVVPEGISILHRGHRPIVQGHVFRFSILLQGCPPPQPELDHVTLVERPITRARRRPSAVVTAYVRIPAHTEQPGVAFYCPAFLGPFVPVSVRTKRPATKLTFFDGSASPPRRVYPVRRAR